MKYLWRYFELALFALGIALTFDMGLIQWIGCYLGLRGLWIFIDLARGYHD